jgi:hypothetical protein
MPIACALGCSRNTRALEPQFAQDSVKRERRRRTESYFAQFTLVLADSRADASAIDKRIRDAYS